MTRRGSSVIVHALLIVGGLLTLFPLLWMLSASFMASGEATTFPPHLVPHAPTLVQYRALFVRLNIGRAFLSSTIVASMVTVSSVLFGSMAGYAFAKLRFGGRERMFGFLLTAIIVPPQVGMLPLFLLMKNLHLVNTYWGVIIPSMVTVFGIFLIRQNVIHSIPDELLEAARIDGAGEFWVFFYIVLPLLRAPLAALGVLAFFQAWTAFTWPLIVSSSKTSYTIEVGLALFQTGFTVDVGRLSAASAVVLIPSVTLFVFLRRHFVQGVASTGLKE